MSELAKRIVSGVVLAALLLGDLWLGSWWYLGLLVIGGVLVYREFAGLALRIASGPWARSLWLIAGLLYIGLALSGLWRVRAIPGDGLFWAAWLFIIVWATDVGAFVFGKAIGGRKIAPTISPSKTWAGLFGGMIMVMLVAATFALMSGKWANAPATPFFIGLSFGLWAMPLAVLAQMGDFFESWMKRRAGVKDSGHLIPGHGGLFDRVDGLIPVAIVFPWWMGLNL